MTTTSLKLSEQLRRRIRSLAKEAGISAHAFMVQAIERQAQLTEKERVFHAQALEADAEMIRTGEGCRLDDVEGWFVARLKGRTVTRPRTISWR